MADPIVDRDTDDGWIDFDADPIRYSDGSTGATGDELAKIVRDIEAGVRPGLPDRASDRVEDYQP